VTPFDKKFGPNYFASIPTSPGIYRVFNEAEELIYVGKAKNLRRRLGQYRNAKRRKKHHKMRKIVAEAARIHYELHPSDLEACRAELKVIQEHRPKWNQAGAFYFLYPVIGVSYASRELTLLFSTEPGVVGDEILSSLSLHGAYRSRHLSGNAFFSLIELLSLVGHQNPAKKIGKYSYLYSFRQVGESWKLDLEKFFRGDSDALLENLIMALVESASARKKGAEIQDLLKDLTRFYRHEARLLARMSKALKVKYPITQKQRDLVLLEYRAHRAEVASAKASLRQ
jgi:predicted GIY-YIG superfamily endonuclease